MNEIIDILGLAFLMVIAYGIASLIGLKLPKSAITKKIVLRGFFGAFGGAVLALFIYVYVLDSNELYFGFVQGLGLFSAIIVTKYLEIGKVTNEAILMGSGMLIGFTIAPMLVHLIT